MTFFPTFLSFKAVKCNDDFAIRFSILATHFLSLFTFLRVVLHLLRKHMRLGS